MLKALNDAIKTLDENNVPPERVVWFNSTLIKKGLEEGILREENGNVSYGGIIVYDATKQHIAVYKDYI